MPNPLEAAGRAPLTACVLANRLDAGVIFDADVDRVMFIDERGTFIRPDVMIAVMAGRLLREHPGATVLQDIRTSRGVTEHLHRLGARTAMWKVGHAFAKLKMRELNAVFGGELAGHYYFREFFWCDSGELAALVALGELAAAHRQGLRCSDLVAPIDRYANTGELNFRITRKREAMEHVKNAVIARQAPSAVLDFDGYRIEYPEWWMSIRLSNTEPFLRLILEAANADLLQTQRARIEALLAPFIDQPVSNPC
jgi:phosphomannomutase